MQKDEKQPNRLMREKSPYLLQHAYNPVDWYPWGEEALARARAEDRPIFLSIGYATCHWCHVMERESFEDREVAALLNEYYVPVKVDREERPDLDQRYMNACQALTGQGGWPLTVFLTPEGEPFFAGTYFPKSSRHGMRGMMDLLPGIAGAWQEKRDRVEQAAAELVAHLEQDPPVVSGAGPGAPIIAVARQQLGDSFDSVHGGFGFAPKFPSPHQLSFLLLPPLPGEAEGEEALAQNRRMALKTLRAMHRGGLFDQLAFGVHRYSVDEKWLVPHFEKMLYDQGTTALAALEAYQATGDEEMALMARRILDYVLNDLRSPGGGFYAAEDADSEGAEGTFYVWRPEQLRQVLGAEEGALAADYFGVTAGGNFEGGSSVLHRPHDEGAFAAKRGMTAEDLALQVECWRLKLLEARAARPRPLLDDKIITAWNGLAITALARGGSVLGEERFTEAAVAGVRFVLDHLRDERGFLLRRFREGEAGIGAFLDDYAFTVSALLELYRATFHENYLEEAWSLHAIMLQRFRARPGILYYNGPEQGRGEKRLLAEAYDGALPSGLSMAALNMVFFARLRGDEVMLQEARDVIAAQEAILEKVPTGHTVMLRALYLALAPPEELVITGRPGAADTEKLAAVARRAYRPALSLLMAPGGVQPGGILAGRRDLPGVEGSEDAVKDAPAPGAARAYYCHQGGCRPPLDDPAALGKLLASS